MRALVRQAGNESVLGELGRAVAEGRGRVRLPLDRNHERPILVQSKMVRATGLAPALSKV